MLTSAQKSRSRLTMRACSLLLPPSGRVRAHQVGAHSALEHRDRRRVLGFPHPLVPQIRLSRSCHSYRDLLQYVVLPPFAPLAREILADHHRRAETIAPGSRMGWITANPLFIERMERANESSTQAGSGFTQAFVAKLLVEEWGMTGWLRWLKGESCIFLCWSTPLSTPLTYCTRHSRASPLAISKSAEPPTASLSPRSGLKAQYRDRRDMLVDCLLEQGHAGLDSRSSNTRSAQAFELCTRDLRSRDEKGYLAEEKMSEKSGVLASKGGKTLLSFVAPQGGMFGAHPFLRFGRAVMADLFLLCSSNVVWLRVHLSAHPSYPHHTTTALLGLLWEQIAEANVLIAPGSMFSGVGRSLLYHSPPSPAAADPLAPFHHQREFGKDAPSPSSIDAHARELFGLNAYEEVMASPEGDGFFRLSFSTASEQEMRTAAKVVGSVVKKFFEEA